MNLPIKFREIGATDWTTATLIDGIDGGYAVQIGAGKAYLTMDKNGTTRVSDAIGPWEGHWRLDPGIPLLHITPNIISYAIEVNEL